MAAAAVTLQAAVRAGATVRAVATVRAGATAPVVATLEDRLGAGMLGHFDDSGLGFTSITKQKLRTVPLADRMVDRPAATLRRMVVLAPPEAPVADRPVATITVAVRPVAAIPSVAILAAELQAAELLAKEVTLVVAILAVRLETTRNR